MTQLRPIVALALILLAFPSVSHAQQKPETEWIIEPLREEGWAEYNPETRVAVATNGVVVRYRGTVLTAEEVRVDESTSEVTADGDVRIQQGDQLWVSEHIRYNFETRKIEAQQFRTGQNPAFASGQGLHANTSNRMYFATNALVTTEDVAQPGIKLRAKYIRIVPGKRIVAKHAVLYVYEVPVFYFPYYVRNLGEHASNFNFTPGYRSLYGAFLLGTYTWYWNEYLDGVLHADYRSKRGPGAGPDFRYHLGKWGDGALRYYYTHDDTPNVDNLGVPIDKDRQRVWFTYLANPTTNLSARAMVRYESDLAVVRDFFEGEYRHNPQPNTYFEANHLWNNFGLDLYVEPRVNQWLETVERLPEAKLTGYRQQVGNSPLYYDSESSVGYYSRQFAEEAGTFGPPPGTNYSAGRADTYHQLTMPETLFGWLNVAPRVGGRFSAYSQASGPGGTTDDQYRGVFNTGMEVSFKASRLWPGVQSDTFELDGLRHIIEPSANYVFVPDPSVPPTELPQFDFERPSFRLLPIEYPDYNAIDSIDTRNVLRWGLRNKLQTKREGKLVNVVNWNVYTDWRLQRESGQSSFSDIYSDFAVRPTSWMTLESLMRYDIQDNRMRMAYTTLTLQPNNVWAWRVGHYHLRDDYSSDPTALGEGNNVLSSALFFRLNENWGFRASHYYDNRTGKLEEQDYAIYRDMRSWTAALTFRVRNNTTGSEDYTVAFTFSLKAFPRFGLGGDAFGPFPMLGL